MSHTNPPKKKTQKQPTKKKTWKCTAKGEKL